MAVIHANLEDLFHTEAGTKQTPFSWFSQTTFSYLFLWKQNYFQVFLCKFHWSLFIWVHLTNSHHWFRYNALASLYAGSKPWPEPILTKIYLLFDWATPSQLQKGQEVPLKTVYSVWLNFFKDCHLGYLNLKIYSLIKVSQAICFNDGSTLAQVMAQVMAWCLTAPSQYLNQCWLIISEVQWHSH